MLGSRVFACEETGNTFDFGRWFLGFLLKTTKEINLTRLKGQIEGRGRLLFWVLS